jgi:hypothetical protein
VSIGYVQSAALDGWIATDEPFPSPARSWPRWEAELPAYLVRFVDDHDLVGIFFPNSIGQLCDLVDECCDIDECEYTELPPGGVYWTDEAIAVPVQAVSDDDEDEPRIPWAGAMETESWTSRLYNGPGNWKPLRLDGADDERPLPPRRILKVVK